MEKNVEIKVDGSGWIVFKALSENSHFKVCGTREYRVVSMNWGVDTCVGGHSLLFMNCY